MPCLCNWKNEYRFIKRHTENKFSSTVPTANNNSNNNIYEIEIEQFIQYDGAQLNDRKFFENFKKRKKKKLETKMWIN